MARLSSLEGQLRDSLRLGRLSQLSCKVALRCLSFDRRSAKCREMLARLDRIDRLIAKVKKAKRRRVK